MYLSNTPLLPSSRTVVKYAQGTELNSGIFLVIPISAEEAVSPRTNRAYQPENVPCGEADNQACSPLPDNSLRSAP